MEVLDFILFTKYVLINIKDLVQLVSATVVFEITLNDSLSFGGHEI